MNKSEIRKRVLKLRKKNYLYKTQFNFKSVINILKKKKYTKKIIGGYFPYNYEVNILPILERFENLNYSLLLPKIDKNSQMNFFNWSTKPRYKLLGRGLYLFTFNLFWSNKQHRKWLLLER